MPKLRIKKTNYYIASILLCILIPWTAITKCHQMSVCTKSLQSCLTLCDPVDCSPPGFSVRGILQARILEWVATPSSRDLLDPGVEPASPVLAGGFFFFFFFFLPLAPPGKPAIKWGLKHRNLWFHHPGSWTFKIQTLAREIWEHTHTQGEKHVKMEAEIRMMLLQVRKAKVKVIQSWLTLCDSMSVEFSRPEYWNG